MSDQRSSRAKRRQQGFSLLELSLVMIILSFVVSALLTLGTNQGVGARIELTNQRMDKIEEAIGLFLLQNNRLPCPAEGYLPPTDADYGRESTASCTATLLNMDDSMEPSGGDTSDLNDIHVGTVPVVSLGLSDEYMLDGWNRRFTYVVSAPYVVDFDDSGADTIGFLAEDLTDVEPEVPPFDANAPAGLRYGNIIVYPVDDETGAGVGSERSLTAGMVLLSYGANGIGAWPKEQTAGTFARINRATVSDGEGENAHTPHTTPTATAADALSFDGQFTQEAGNSDFDDILRFYERWQLIEMAGGINDNTFCQAILLANQPTNPGTTPPEGAVGCENSLLGEAGYTPPPIDPNCEFRQRLFAQQLLPLCFVNVP